MAKDYAKEIDDIIARLKYLTQEMEHIHKQQTDLEMMLGEYPQIDELKQQIKPFQELWILQNQFQDKFRLWKHGVLNQINPDEVEADHRKMYGTANKLYGRFERMKPQTVAKKIKTELEEFRKYVPIIRCLCNPGMKERHVDEIFQLLRVPKDSGKELNEMKLKQFEDYEIISIKNDLEEISDRASKQFSNENTMKKMKGEWAPLMFETSMPDGKDAYILTGEAVENIQTVLDDHIIKTQTMKGSPFAKFMINEIDKWERVLIRTQDNLDLWLKVQNSWMYLEPVFSSEDIINQMPVEGAKFREVNIAWKDLMRRIHRDPEALTVIEMDELGSILGGANEKLERVYKGLNDYLESKRALFPRFFFLSNDELLEILSETKEPLRVQPHLKKCFEGIAKLEFDDEKKIHGMYSIEGELVPYTRIIDPIASKGQVEDWLVQVEEVMLKSVKDVIEKSMNDYKVTNRAKWITSHTG